MKFSINNIVFVLCLSFGVVEASVSDYQQIYQEEQKEFTQKMRTQIKKDVEHSSRKVQELYGAIDYQPIWVDKDYLTQYAELLIYELKEDFDKGLDVELHGLYKKLLPEDKDIFDSNALAHKVKVELGMMQLYVKHIEDILKKKKSKYTATTLLQFAMKEKSLIHALNAISEERITYCTPMLDKSKMIIKPSEKANKDNIAMLTNANENKRLKAMYALLDFQPVWIGKSGVSHYTKELFEQIENDNSFDISCLAYKSYTALKLLALPTQKKEIENYEMEVAKLYQDYMSHLLYGDIDWKAFQAKIKKKKNADWVVHNVLSSPESLLIEAISHESLAYAFKEATPRFPLYQELLVALGQYQDIAASGGWEVLAAFETLKPDTNHSVVPLLRERLRKEGDYVSCADMNETTIYDACLMSGVKKFQQRHGLSVDGYVGKMTLKALNESAEDKVARIKLNLDRMKWVKRSHDRYQIWVNIPGYKMYVFDEGKMIQSMKVIVGRKGHNTPVFYNRVRTIVLNPYWRIPASIIRHELIPKLKKNSNYTNSKKIEIHTGYSEHSPKVNPFKVNWHKYGRRLPPYKFMQSPGKHNALGKIKYLFPNKYSVYMHDTNQPYLFDKDERAMSHGCVRLHKPVELLETFSIMDKKIDFEKSKKVLEKNKKTPLRLSQAIPVDIIYLTTWVDSEGVVSFRDDIYGYDKMQLSTMKIK